MKILVTGATGFVGSCLARRLCTLGHEVNVFTRSSSNLWRLADLMAKVENHQVDLRDHPAVEKTVRTIRPDIVFHLATYGGFTFQQETANILTSNLVGMVNLVKACEKIEFPIFVNTGSSSEYGIKDRPMREGDILEPVGDYGVAKAAATLFCRSEAVRKGLPMFTLRLFSPFGPWDDPKRLIPYVIKSLLAGEPPTLSSPHSVRDYIFIDDVVDCYVSFIGRPVNSGEVFNIGSGRQYSIGEVVERLRKIIDNSVAPLWGVIADRRFEPSCWVADMAKTGRKLDWVPTVPLEEGLARTVNWLRNNLKFYS
jgi:nucleoside-diphosphate-sugar epimerase